MKLCSLLLLMLVIVPSSFAQTKIATVHIRVLDSHSGKPIRHANTSTLVFPLSPYTTPIERRADRQGALTLLVPTEGRISVAVTKYAGCQHLSKADRAKGPTRVSLQEIFATGVLDTNGCRLPKMQPKPSELVVYVRPLHWW